MTNNLRFAELLMEETRETKKELQSPLIRLDREWFLKHKDQFQGSFRLWKLEVRLYFFTIECNMKCLQFLHRLRIMFLTKLGSVY